MLFLPEGRTGKAREPSKKLWSFGIREHWIEKYFHLALKGTWLYPTQPSQRNLIHILLNGNSRN